jgi:hypothetical protein
LAGRHRRKRSPDRMGHAPTPAYSAAWSRIRWPLLAPGATVGAGVRQSQRAAETSRRSASGFLSSRTRAAQSTVCTLLRAVRSTGQLVRSSPFSSYLYAKRGISMSERN